MLSRAFIFGGRSLHRHTPVSSHLHLQQAHTNRFLQMAAPGVNADGSLKKYATPEPTTVNTKAAVAGDIEAIKKVPTDALNAQDDAGNTMLIWASDKGQAEAVKLLLEKGADANVKGFIGNTALSRAARSGHTDIVRALLDAPSMASANTPNDKMQYPLHFAAFKRHRNTVQAMLEYPSVDTTVLDRKGRTPAEDTSDEVIRDMILAERKKRATASM
mmetsp:Transcript_54421/g.129695  ORF Transcript_54421/g.129695 Transcript_54421/m.129695 type:complete len:217 (+) Transcript_54421:17-667(+)